MIQDTIFKYFLLLSLLFCSCQLHADNPDRIFDVKKMVIKKRSKHVEKLLGDFLKATRPARLVGTPGHKKAQDFLKNYLKQFQGKVEVQEFTPKVQVAKEMFQNDFAKQVKGKIAPNNPQYAKWQRFTLEMSNALETRKSLKGQNIIWRMDASVPTEKTLIVGGHYDTFAHDDETKKLMLNSPMPGADDNASAVVIALLLVEHLSSIKLNYNVQVVFFDWEEFGFLGSYHFVEQLNEQQKNNILGYINLEMLGYDSRIKDADKKYGNLKVYIRKPSEDKGKHDKKLAERLVAIGDKIGPGANFKIVPNSFNASDHWYFWQNEIPALTFTQNWESDFNPHYHSRSDSYELINFDTLHDAYCFITGAVISYLLDIRK